MPCRSLTGRRASLGVEGAVERQSHVADGLHPLLRIFLETPAKVGLQSSRKVVVQRTPVRLGLDDRREGLSEVLTRECAAPREHFCQRSLRSA